MSGISMVLVSGSLHTALSWLLAVAASNIMWDASSNFLSKSVVTHSLLHLHFSVSFSVCR